MRRGGLALLVVLVALLAPAAAQALVNYADIESQFMCVSCKIPLSIADSTQASLEKQFLHGLVSNGAGEKQIKDAMVSQYGPNVLALPSDKGFGLAAYAIPIALVILLGLGLALMLPRWRRRRPAGMSSAAGTVEGTPPAAALSGGDLRRLDEDLARYEI